MKVVFSREALHDIEAISEYIARDNRHRAITFTAELIEAALHIAETPLAYNFIQRYVHAGIRRKLHRSYLIFYQVEEERVGIVHVLHSSQDYEAVLFPED